MTFPKVPIEKINKMPLAYALMIVGGLLGIFATKFFDNNEAVIKAYKAENADLKSDIRVLNRKCDSVALFWQNRYVGSLEKAQELQRKKDSTDHATLTKPNRDLLRAIKKRR